MPAGCGEHGGNHRQIQWPMALIFANRLLEQGDAQVLG